MYIPPEYLGPDSYKLRGPFHPRQPLQFGRFLHCGRLIPLRTDVPALDAVPLTLYWDTSMRPVWACRFPRALLFWAKSGKPLGRFIRDHDTLLVKRAKRPSYRLDLRSLRPL